VKRGHGGGRACPSSQAAGRQKWRGWLCSVAVAAAGCAARPPARSFPDLQERLKRGTTVEVTDETGTDTRGTVIDVSPSALILAVDGVQRRMDQHTVRQVQTYGDPLWNGLLVGMAVATPAMLIADPTYDPCPNNVRMRCANSHVGQRILAISIMGGIGAGIDALIRGRHQVYLSPGRSAASVRRVTVVPHIGPSTAAVFIARCLP
jgi:hypothetical protein